MSAETVDFPMLGGDDGALAWQEQALCAQTDPEAFFPEKGCSTREAKRICVSCEVKAECLQYALDVDERFGIWGGLSERERRRLKRAGGNTSHLSIVLDEDDVEGDEDEVPAPHVNAMAAMHQAAVRSQIEQTFTEHADPKEEPAAAVIEVPLISPDAVSAREPIEDAPVLPQRGLREPVILDWDSLSLIPELCGPPDPPKPKATVTSLPRTTLVPGFETGGPRLPAEPVSDNPPSAKPRLTKAQRARMKELVDQGYSKERSRQMALAGR